jgi:hypothetical protein
MLKKILITAFAIGYSNLSCISNANAGEIEETLANICAIVEADDKGELRKKMRTVRTNFSIKLRDYYGGISCGGNSLIRVAILNESTDTGMLLVKKMPKKLLTAPEADGKTILAWISEQGFDGSPITQEVKDRL